MLAVLKAAALLRCRFCADIGSAEARQAGITEEQLLALPRYRESDAFDELERLVLDYAVAMTCTPPEVGDELFAALREHFDERQMVELTNIIALENLRSRFNIAFDMDPAGFSEGRVCIVPESPPAAAERGVRILLAGATGVIGRGAAAAAARTGPRGGRDVPLAGQARGAARPRAPRRWRPTRSTPARSGRSVARARPQAVIHQLTAIPAHINPRTMERDFAQNDRLRARGDRQPGGRRQGRGRRALHRPEHRLRLRPRSPGHGPRRGRPADRAGAGPEGVPPLGGRGRRSSSATVLGRGRRGAPLRVLLRPRQRGLARGLDGRRRPPPPAAGRGLRRRRVVLHPRRRRRLGDGGRARPARARRC